MKVEELCMGCMSNRGDAEVCPHCGWTETTVPASPLFLPPRTILDGQYVVGRVLGHGGFGVTYLAWDQRLHRRVAIKEYLPMGVAGRASGRPEVTVYQSKQDYDWGLSRFIEEGRVLARFQDHPGIAWIINHFSENGTAYLAMEYLEGRTLLEHLNANGGKISYDSAIAILIPVLEALRELHRAGVLHRDISPDNIFITTGGQVKLLDFGAARQALGQKSRNLSVVLKEGYAPEEQYRTKGQQGPWTDVYAVAATIYRSITGRTPPSATDRLFEDEIQAPSAIGADISPDSEAALMKALAVRSEDRFASIEDCQAALSGQPLGIVPGMPAQTGTPAIHPPLPKGSGATGLGETPPGPVEPGQRTDSGSGGKGLSQPAPQIPRWLWVSGVAALLILWVAFQVRPKPEADPKNKQKVEDSDSNNPKHNSDGTPSDNQTSDNDDQNLPDNGHDQSGPPQNNYQGLMDQGLSLLKRGQPLLAIGALQNAVKLDSSLPDAYGALAWTELYFYSDTRKAGQFYRSAWERGGPVVFRIKHDLGDGMFTRARNGRLSVSPSQVSYVGDDGVRVFSASRRAIREAKLNSKFIPRPLAPSSFHIKIGRENYNLAPTSAAPRQEADMVLGFLKRK